MREREMLTYMFKEPGWLGRLLVGAYAPLTIIGAMAVSGYLAESMRLTMEGRLRRLPPWGRWADRSIMGAMLLSTDLVYLFVPALAAGAVVLCISTVAGALGAPLRGQDSRAVPWLLGLAGLAWLTYLAVYLLFNLGVLPKAMWLIEVKLDSALTPGWVWRVARQTARDLWPARRITLVAYLPVVGVALAGLGFESLIHRHWPALTAPAILLALAIWAPVWFWARLVAMRAYAQAIGAIGWESLLRW
jgi:hypothetical protein